MAAGVAPQLGLELKARYAAMLVKGEKTVELRRYAIPDAYLGRPVLLLATPDGEEGRSTLPDVLPVGHPGASIAGTVTFGSQVIYASYEQFSADEARHCVPPTGTPYGWMPGVTTELFGWVVERAAPCSPANGDARQRGSMRRVLSSWFASCEAA